MRLIAIALVVLLSGCTTLKDWSPWEIRLKAPDSAVNVAELESAVDTLRARYIALREDVKAEQPNISKADWDELVAIDETMIEAGAYIAALRSQSGDVDMLLMTLRETSDIGSKISAATIRLQTVMARNTHLFDPVTRVDYVTASGQLTAFREQMTQIVKAPTPKERADLFTQLAYLAAAMLGAPQFN